MKISLSKHAGFCEGVKRAYDTMLDAVADPAVKKPIYIMGSLVHNQDVVESLSKLGVRRIKIDRHLFKNLRAMKKEIGTLVITAHGMGPVIYDFCRREKIALLDTTCPRVTRVQRLAKNFSEKLHKLIIIGDKEHKEIKGINEWSGNTAKVVEKMADLRKLKLPSAKKIAVLFQTTQDLDFMEISSSFFSNFCPNAKVMNTICQATNYRQKEVREIAQTSEAVVVIGSPESANSRRLWEIAKKINPHSYFIENIKGLKKEWFANMRRIGITAGASTPDWVIQDVVESLKKI